MYRYVADADAAETALTLPARQRDELVRLFRRLAERPFQEGETYFADATGRRVQRRRFGNWIISFWADHAVSELRVVAIQRVKR